MKTTFYVIALLTFTLYSCNKREINHDTDNLITPRLELSQSNNPYTGLLSIYPCQDGSSIYFGNYNNNQLSRVYASYVVAQGNITQSNPQLTLPAGNYYLLYWGISKAITESYESPSAIEPQVSIGNDTKQLSLSLRSNLNDTTFMPTFDYVFNARSTQVGTENVSIPLRRVVAGLEIIIRRDNNQPLDTSIRSIDILVSNIAGKLNLYDAMPSDYNCTVAFPLTISDNRMSANNKMATVFPSDVRPAFAIVITLGNGQKKVYRTSLNNILVAGTNVNITVDMGQILVEESSGNGFTVTGWNEQSETITTGPI